MIPSWIAIWIARFVSGEHLRPGERADYRYWFGVLFLFPAEVVVFALICSPLFQRSGIAVWLVLTTFGLVALFSGLLWATYVPAGLSLGLAVVAWACAFWAAWQYL
jgi:hypothetical protein